MTPQFTMAAVQRAHVPAIHAMVHELAVYEKLEHLVSGDAAAMERELFGDYPSEHPIIEAIVALIDNEPQGFALYFHNYSTFLARRGLYLEDLYVRPAFRRRGMGRALLLQLARTAVQRGCGRFEWSVLDWNTPAIEFYERLGATVMPEWRIARVTGDSLKTMAALRY